MKRPRNPVDTVSARGIAFDILLRVETAGAFASILLDRHEPRPSDPRDVALVRELVLGVLRRQRILDHVVDEIASRPAVRMDPEVRTAMRLGAYSLLFLDRVPPFAAVNGAVELAKHRGRPGSAGFVNGVLRSLARRGADALPRPPAEGDTDRLALYHSHPQWWVERVVARAGWDRAVRLLDRNNLPAGTVMRPNLTRISQERLTDRLAAEGLDGEPGTLAPGAVRLGRAPLAKTATLDDGLAWVQDEAAQLVPMLFGDRLGHRVLDMCAAPGGKTMQLSERRPAAGLIVASDRHLGRLKQLARLAQRLGRSEGLAPVRADMAAAATALTGPFDEILLDAPCSGTGTLRRHPEIRWRLREEDLSHLAVTQRSLLDTAARLLRPAGRLVYAVCSLEPEEGEDQIDRFLDRHPGFAIERPPAGFPDAARKFLDDRFRLRISPADADIDGFFAVLMTRSRA